MVLIALIGLLLTIGLAPLVESSSDKDSDAFNFYQSLASLGVKPNHSPRLPELLAAGDCSSDCLLWSGHQPSWPWEWDLGFVSPPRLGNQLLADLQFPSLTFPYWSPGLPQQQFFLGPIFSIISPITQMPTSYTPALFDPISEFDGYNAAYLIGFSQIPAAYGSADAPGPLPLFGVAITYINSRNLRKRMRRSGAVDKG